MDTAIELTNSSESDNPVPSPDLSSDDGKSHSESGTTKDSFNHQNTFMTDEGNAFPGVADHFGWRHLLDRKHFSEQILQSWGGLDDPQQYRDDMYRILDEASVEKLDDRLANARSSYTTAAAQTFIDKLNDLRHKLCFAYLQSSFTAGHVADQRCEGGMSTLKGNGKLKKFLATCTYGQSLERVAQVSRDQDISALDELKRCREKGMQVQVGERYATAFLNSKVTALRMSYVEAVPNSATLYTKSRRMNSRPSHV